MKTLSARSLALARPPPSRARSPYRPSQWAVTEASDGLVLKSGLYWAKAKRIVFEEGARMVCRGDTSRKIFVD